MSKEDFEVISQTDLPISRKDAAILTSGLVLVSREEHPDISEKEPIQVTSDLVLGGAGGLWGLVKDYPYEYRTENEDGTVTFTFSKKPILKPSMVERADIESKIEILENDYYHALDKLVGGAKMTKRQQKCLYDEYLVLKEKREKRINEHIHKISEGDKNE